MKKTLLIARILTWFNLIFWGGIIALGLLGLLFRQQGTALLSVVLFCAIPLHAYAALQLQKVIRHPNLKLNRQTPTGIRFVGFVALFLGIVLFANGYVMISEPKTALEVIRQSMPDPNQLTDARALGWMHPVGIFLLVIGAIVILNVVLNNRLLRWYFHVRKSDNGGTRHPGDRPQQD